MRRRLIEIGMGIGMVLGLGVLLYPLIIAVGELIAPKLASIPRASAAVVCTPNGTLTTYLSLCKPLAGERNWDAAINNNFTVLDTLAQGNSVSLTGQTAAIGNTTLFSPPTAGVYIVTYYVVVTNTGSSTNLVLNILATDDAAARTFPATTVSCAATNFTAGAFVVRPSSGVIQYNTTMTGTCTYALYVRALKMM